MTAGTQTWTPAALQSVYRAQWRGDDFAVFSYTPRRYLRFGDNAASHLVWAVKDEDRDAINAAQEWCLVAAAAAAERVRAAKCRFVVSVPRSTAGRPNVGCEAIAAAIASRLGLQHLPGGLIRTESVPASHLGVRVSVERHIETIAFRPPDQLPTDRYCPACDRHFRTPSGLQWHVANNRDHARQTTSISHGNFLIVDDLLTHGATSTAVRHVLQQRHSVARVLGFYLGRTG